MTKHYVVIQYASNYEAEREFECGHKHRSYRAAWRCENRLRRAGTITGNVRVEERKENRS